MTDDDLVAIILEEKLSKEQQYYRLDSIQVQYGTNQVPTATVTLFGHKMKNTGSVHRFWQY